MARPARKLTRPAQNPVQRPFATRFSVHPAPGVLVLDLGFATAPPEAVRPDIEASIGRFVALANAGALCGATFEPDRCGIDAVSRTVTQAGCRWTMSGVRIDPRSVGPLVNLVHFLHADSWPVATLAIDWEMIARLDAPARLVFPPAVSAPPFSVEIDDDDSGAFDIVLDFDGPQPRALIDQAIEVIGAWLGATIFGAYGSERMLPPMNRVVFGSQPLLRADDGLVFSIDRFAASVPEAFDGLVGVVAKLHRRLLPVRALEIGA